MGRKQSRRRDRLVGQRSTAAATARSQAGPEPTGDLLAGAVQFHQAGDLRRAETLYRKALAAEPENPDALHYLGILAHQTGQTEAAITQLERSLELRPRSAEFHNNLGAVLQECDQSAEAIPHFETALDIEPAYPEAQNNLGVALKALGELARATEAFRRAATLDPGYAEAWSNLADTLREEGRFAEAVEPYRTAIGLRPDLLAAQTGLSQVAGAYAPQFYDPRWDGILSECFMLRYVRPQDLARAASRQIKVKYRIDWRSEAAWESTCTDWEPDRPPEHPGDLLADRLLHDLLENTVITDIDLEIFLTGLRRTLFRAIFAARQATRIQRSIMSSLARQSFNNGYVFWLDEDENADLTRLRRELATDCRGPLSADADIELRLLLFAMYEPVSDLPNAESLCDVPLENWSSAVQPLIRRTLLDGQEEGRLRRDIRTLGPIDDATSRAVRSQYEENPYPRWLSIRRNVPTQYRQELRHRFAGGPEIELPNADGALPVLVAGCGTGQHPIQLALNYSDLRIVAIDLSAASLAYAVRKARQTGARNIEFVQADILNLGALGRQFPIIECIGVLHHMERPASGWAVLTGLLRPGGLLKIGLYSEIARRDIIAARDDIQRLGLAPTAANIRNYRRSLLLSPEADGCAALARIDEFHDLSGCRDLLFHIKERRYTLSSVAEAIQTQSLDFLGFELADPEIGERYVGLYPGDPDMMNLEHWAEFEERYPDTFIGMYNFWCRKPADV